MVIRSDDRTAVTRNDDVSISTVVDMVTTYAKQETVGPLKGAGRFLGYGAAGATLLGIGLALVLLGALRLIQTEWDWAGEGDFSWVSYLIVFTACVLLIVFALSRINKSTLDKERD